MKSLGFLEVTGVVAAIDALDIMCKSANVSLVSWERKLGGRLVTLIITGDVSAVTAAIENAKAQCIKKPCATVVIANPHSETVRLTELSAKRLANDKSGDGENSEPTNEPLKAEEKATAVQEPVKAETEADATAPAKAEEKLSAPEKIAEEPIKTAAKPSAKKAPARKPSAKKKRRDDEDDIWHEKP